MSNRIITHEDGRTFTLRVSPHPGKYEGQLAITEHVHDLTGVGCDDETGDLESTGWYGRINGPFTLVGACVDFVPAVLQSFTTDERRFLQTVAGVIVREDSQGFVTADYFTNRAAIEDAWMVIEREVAAAESEDVQMEEN